MEKTKTWDKTFHMTLKYEFSCCDAWIRLPLKICQEAKNISAKRNSCVWTLAQGSSSFFSHVMTPLYCKKVKGD